MALYIEITKANKQHIPSLGKLWMEFMRYSQSIEAIHEPEEDAIPTYIKDYLRPAMEAEDSLVLVALAENEAVGYSYSFITKSSNLVKRKRYGIIHDMYITSQYRRVGIGQMLYNEIIKWFTLNDIDRVELEVMTRNQMASSFWEKLGFTDLNRTLFRQF